MDPATFFDYSTRTGLFRCRVTGNLCGTDTVPVGNECPMGKDHPCQHRVAFQAGWEAAYAFNRPPQVVMVASCGVCQNTGKVKGETCWVCGGECDYAENRQGT